MGCITTDTISACPRAACSAELCDIGDITFDERLIDSTVLENAGFTPKKPIAGMPFDLEISLCSGMVVPKTNTAKALSETGLLEKAVQIVGVHPSLNK